MTSEIITYLEMTDRAQLCGPSGPRPPFVFRRITPPDPALSRWLYETVGDAWTWIDRRDWHATDWATHVARDAVELWVACVDDAPIGFVELDRQPESNVEIAYFGLLPDYIGAGYGSAVLTAGVEAAWRGETQRVWLHTCNFDHPHALANYQARGFRIYDVEHVAPLSDKTAGGDRPASD